MDGDFEHRNGRKSDQQPDLEAAPFSRGNQQTIEDASQISAGITNLMGTECGAPATGGKEGNPSIVNCRCSANTVWIAEPLFYRNRNRDDELASFFSHRGFGG